MHIPMQRFWKVFLVASLLQATVLLWCSALYAQETRQWLLPPGESLPESWQTETLTQQFSSGWRLVQLSPEADSVAMSAYQQMLSVSGAEPDRLWVATGFPDDPGLTLQWAFETNGQGQRVDIRAREAWNIQKSAREVVVGVLDSGVDWTHPDLINNIWQNLGEDADGDGRVLEYINGQWVFDPGDVNGIDDDGNGYVDDFIGWDFVNDDNNPYDDHFAGHGTHVAGIIGASGNNGIGVSGVAWEVRIMPLKFLDQSGKGYTSGALEALEYARKMGADLTNNSWGAPFRSEALAAAIDSAGASGQLFVAAAGNNFGNNNDKAPFYPAAYPFPHVVAVTATNALGHRSVFANVGASSVDLGAPGTGIYSTLPGNTYGFFSGTSMAAPFVTGALALLIATQPTMPIDVKVAKLLRSTDPLADLQTVTQAQGQLNLWKLLRRPIRFDKILDRPETEAPLIASADNRSLMAGNSPDSAWVTAFSAPGQIAWSKSYEAGVKLRSLTSYGEAGWVLAGTASGSSWIQQLAHNGELQWSFELEGANSPSVATITVRKNRVLAAGHLANGDLWMLGLDTLGTLLWQHRFPATGRKIHLLDSSSDLFMLVDRWQGNLNQIALLRFDDSGQYLDARTWSIQNEVSSTGLHSLEDEEDEWTLGLLVTQPSGVKEAWIWEGEDELEPEKGFGYALSPTTKDAFTQVWPDGGWIISSHDSVSQTNQLIGTDVKGTELFATAFPTDFELSGVGPVNDGGVVMAGKVGSGNSSEWILRKTDPRGLANCPGAPVASTPISVPLLSGQSLSLAPTNPGLTLSPGLLGMVASSLSAAERCGPNTCETEAFFLLPQGTLCEDDFVAIPSLSQHATSYEWRIDGVVVSNDSILNLQIDDDEFLVSLTASNGNCSDEMSLRLEVEPEIEYHDIDTTRCAPSISLEAPIRGVSYEWLDDNENVIGTGPQQRITQSGEYQLIMIDQCGNDWEQDIEVTLSGNCVWPGDVNADGAVDQLDFLLLGLVHGQTGPARSNASSLYEEQTGLPWPGKFPDSLQWAPGINLQHADCDGDGVIDIELDRLVVLQNRTAAFIPPVETQPSSLSLTLTLPQGQANVGDTIPLSVSLSDTSGQSPPIYGLSFSIRYNLPLNQGIIFTLPPSWLGTPGADLAELSIGKTTANASEVSIVRFDLQNRLGQGAVIGGGIVIQIDDIGSYALSGQQAYLSLDLLDAFAIQADGSRVPIREIRVQGNQTVQIDVPTQELQLRAALQGAWDSGSSMHSTALHDLGLLPTFSPYAQAPASYVPTLEPVTDWVLVEFRDSSDLDQIVSRLPGLLLPNGQIVDPATRGPLRPALADGDYYVVMKHRNHLAVRSPLPVSFSSGTTVSLNWTNTPLAIDGKAQLFPQGASWVIPAGDVNQDGQIIWSGTGNDQRFLLQKLQGQPQNSISGYFAEDLNLDGFIRYQGTSSDQAIFQQLFQGISANQIIQSYVP